LEWDPALEIGRKLCDSSRVIDDKNFKNTSKVMCVEDDRYIWAYACTSSKSQGQFSVLLVTRTILGLGH
jgi:hypothetical protein